MSIIDRALLALLDKPIRRLVAEELARYSHGTDPNPLYRYRVHGNLARLHIDPTAVVNDALFNVSSGEIRGRPPRVLRPPGRRAHWRARHRQVRP